MVLRLFIFMEIRLFHPIPTGFGTKLSYFFQDYAIFRVNLIESVTTFLIRELDTRYKRAPVAYAIVRVTTNVCINRSA